VDFKKQIGLCPGSEIALTDRKTDHKLAGCTARRLVVQCHQVCGVCLQVCGVANWSLGTGSPAAGGCLFLYTLGLLCTALHCTALHCTPRVGRLCEHRLPPPLPPLQGPLHKVTTLYCTTAQYCTLHTVLHTLNTLHTAHCTLHTTHCTLYCTHCTLYTAHTLHTAHCTLYTVHCTLHNTAHCE
jgi:hypothetical protein